VGFAGATEVGCGASVRPSLAASSGRIFLLGVRTIRFVKYWEIIADNLSKAAFSWGCVSAFDSSGRTIFVADAHRGDGKRLVVRANEKLTAFMELESARR